MNSHTPGPWTIQQITAKNEGYDWQTFAIRSAQNVCLATVGDADRFESERIPANARLIAAAPSMLEALEELTSKFHTCHAAGTYPCIHDDKARAILRYVRGQ